MNVSRLRVRGYKSIREMDLSLGSLNVLIGANGAGKTNLISVFNFFNQIVSGSLQNFVGRSGGADTLLYFGQKTTSEIFLRLDFDSSEAYWCTLVPTTEDTLILSGEHGIRTAHDSGQVLLETHIHHDHKESFLTRVERVGEDGTHSFDVIAQADRIKIYHFHDTSESAKVKKTGDINDNALLRSDAGNLAAFLYMLRGTSRDHYQRIVEVIRLAAPFFDDFVLRPTPMNPDRIRLEWKEKASDAYFNASYLSDGTLRFICLSTLLLQPSPPTTILIDEPELGLHPAAIALLASMMKSAATNGQIIVSTQSATLLNHFSPQEVIVVERDQDQSTFRRLEPSVLTEWLEDYSMGELWEKNVLGGRP
jgi:predicted ATPase